MHESFQREAATAFTVLNMKQLCQPLDFLLAEKKGDYSPARSFNYLPSSDMRMKAILPTAS